MRLHKLLTVFGISTCLVGSSVFPAFAQDPTVIQQEHSEETPELESEPESVPVEPITTLTTETPGPASGTQSSTGSSENAGTQGGAGGSESAGPQGGAGGSESSGTQSGAGGSESAGTQGGAGGSESSGTQGGAGGSESSGPQGGTESSETGGTEGGTGSESGEEDGETGGTEDGTGDEDSEEDGETGESGEAGDSESSESSESSGDQDGTESEDGTEADDTQNDTQTGQGTGSGTGESQGSTDSGAANPGSGSESAGDSTESGTAGETGAAGEDAGNDETGETVGTGESDESNENAGTCESGEAAGDNDAVPDGGSEAAEDADAETSGDSGLTELPGDVQQQPDPAPAPESNIPLMPDGNNSGAQTAVNTGINAPLLNNGWFKASAPFIDNRSKVKYNVDLPLENIPSFITQEMIIGALKCQDETGYPASVTIAQIIAESGFGKYGPGGDKGQGLSYLAYQYNNLFGIKGTGPAGSINMKTGEQAADGSMYSINAGFRVYNTYTECIQDRAELLEEVYSDLIEDVDDANTFAVKIGGRWATDLDYGQTLIQIMERYDLYRLDEMTVGQFSDMLGFFVNPCPGGYLTSRFGYRTAPTAGATTYHQGIDLETGSYNIPTYAAAAGTVTFAGEAGAEGRMVVIDHGNGLVTRYKHHDRIYVEAGDKVEKGQQIGLSGTTGVSTGNHLHFQVELNGIPVDPLTYLQKTENQ